MKNFLTLCLITTFIFSCGKLVGNSTGANDLLSDGLIGGSSAISIGNSRYIFEGSARNSGQAAQNYKVIFNLNENQDMDFYIHSDRKLEKGGQFHFSRIGGEVFLDIIINGKQDRKKLEIFKNTNPIDIEIDFHNDHTDVHVLVWRLSGPHEDQEGCSFSNRCLYNTEDFALDVWLGIGKAQGAYWGMQGDRNSILSIVGPNLPRSNL